MPEWNTTRIIDFHYHGLRKSITCRRPSHQIRHQREETTNENKRTVTILIPCYNEEESLPMLFARLTTLSENA